MKGEGGIIRRKIKTQKLKETGDGDQSGRSSNFI